MKTVLRVTSGNFLEMFDFFLFGIYASHIAHTFFPNDNEFVSMMSTFLSFAAGFVMRPIGALVLGPYIDRMGRRQGLIVTLSIMAMGTILIAFVPGYATIGIAAPLLVLVGRLLQGFSAGVELAAFRSISRKWQHRSQRLLCQLAVRQPAVAIVVGALLGFIINRTLMPQQISDWGWRIPFFIGCMIVPFIFVIRRSLQETKEFANRKHQPTTREIFATLISNWGVVLGGVGMVIMTTVSFYLITVYTPSFGKTVLKLSESDALLATMAVGISNFVWLPIAGAVSDKVGRKPILITFSLLALFTAYPALSWLITNITFERMVIVELWLSFIYAWYNGAMVVALTEVIPEACAQPASRWPTALPPRLAARRLPSQPG